MNHPHVTPQLKIQKLYRVTLYKKWLIVCVCWLTLGSFGIWGLRHEFSLWQSYFTWSAVRYGLAYHRLSTLCLAFCIGLTLGVLVSQSRELLWGLSEKERYRLQQKVQKICDKGASHPLYRFICK